MKKNLKDKKPETILIHAGYDIDEKTYSVAVPIYQTTSYHFENSEHAAGLFSLDKTGNIYTRMMNPTTDVLEKRIAALDGGIGAVATASGQSAIMLAILNLASTGDEIVAANNLYGGTFNLLKHTFAKFGIKIKFVDPSDLPQIQKNITSKTKAIYAESIGNPNLQVADFDALSKIAHKNKIPLIIDNTFSPYILKPFDYGADIIVYSATKFIGGHGNSIAGLVVDSGKFDWKNKKFATISAPDPSYHGLDFVKNFGNMAYILKLRTNLLRDTGACLSPFNAFLMLQGLETLHLRMERHCENALKIAKYLKQNPKIAWVNYPGLGKNETAKKYLKNGFGSMLGFGIKGGKTAGKKFIDSLNLISHVANVGDTKTLAIHPASTTHQQLTEKEQIAGGISPDYIRLSIGIENVDDIIDDLGVAISRATKNIKI